MVGNDNGDGSLTPTGTVGVGVPNLKRARELCEYLQSSDAEYARFIEWRKSSHGEIVVFEVEVELGQISAHPIQRFEKLSVQFYTSDDQYPEVLSLRGDFPQVPHINLTTEPFPRSLCLYEQPYNEIKLNWCERRSNSGTGVGLKPVRFWLV